MEKKRLIVVSDVDGVLTDGSFYYDETGKCMKKFGRDDADALKMLRKNLPDAEVHFCSSDFHGFAITEKRIKEQITADLAGLTKEQVKDLVIAYEPIWAIGTGKTATPEMANATCGYIRFLIDNMYGEETADAIRIQYGGSVKVANIEALMLQPHIDGALIGGASLVAEDFIHFAKVAASIKY